jgi:hypothetical protein
MVFGSSFFIGIGRFLGRRSCGHLFTGLFQKK